MGARLRQRRHGDELSQLSGVEFWRDSRDAGLLQKGRAALAGDVLQRARELHPRSAAERVRYNAAACAVESQARLSVANAGDGHPRRPFFAADRQARRPRGYRCRCGAGDPLVRVGGHLGEPGQCEFAAGSAGGLVAGPAVRYGGIVSAAQDPDVSAVFQVSGLATIWYLEPSTWNLVPRTLL